jgi:hypothetical protein
MMRSALTTLLLGLVLALSLFLAWVLLTPIPTTTELDNDLKQVRSDISAASSESEKYAGGLLKILIEVRRQTLQNTEAMLEQKRASVLRRINLDYRINGTLLHPASDKELNDINEEIQQAERKLAQSISNAKQYSGGLVQIMALATIETDKLALSTLRLKFYSAKYGFPFGGLGEREHSILPGRPPPSPGNIVKDRDAL